VSDKQPPLTVEDAFASLLAAIESTGRHVGGQDDRADGYAYATELVRVALDLYADADGESPRFVPFSTPVAYHAGSIATDRVQGGVNPDGLYDFAIPPSQRRPASLDIEVLDAPPSQHRSTESVARRIGAAAAFLRSTNAHYPFPESPLSNAFGEPLGYVGSAGALGTTDNTYCMGRWRLSPGERLAIETTPIPCGYWGLQAWNRWGQSLAHSFDDANHRRQIINHETAVLRPDGSVRVVLSDRDPGEPNWLDTCGFSEGVLIFRYLYPETKPERPRTEVTS
jgi:hypothetical protein